MAIELQPPSKLHPESTGAQCQAHILPMGGDFSPHWTQSPLFRVWYLQPRRSQLEGRAGRRQLSSFLGTWICLSKEPKCQLREDSFGWNDCCLWQNCHPGRCHVIAGLHKIIAWVKGAGHVSYCLREAGEEVSKDCA